VLDFGASGEGRGADRVTKGMHERAQALLLCLVTCGVQLLLRHRHRATRHAAGGINLDQIRAGRLLFPNENSDFIRRPCLLTSTGERSGGGQYVRARKSALRNGIAQKGWRWVNRHPAQL
jgi:hypothetical protein